MKKTILILLAALTGVFAGAQENKTPEEREKELYESIQKQVDRLAEQLNLTGGQIFYVDSILTHDYNAMVKELNDMSTARVSNGSLYEAVQDKWAERIYQAFEKLFTQEQWQEYLKSGASREKKLRDKRATKLNKKQL
ncbi:MAG: hypothetical protein J1D85_02455 [Bacteroidales bacterium]|nr:hypothetical protein [Bacteroidales bacterium]